MNLMLNKDDVIIDIVETVKPVCKNKNGITILCNYEEAQGFVGSDNDTIYAKVGSQFQPTYYDIAKLVSVDKIPRLVEALKYKYVDEAFVQNEDVYPATNTELTSKYGAIEDALLEISEIVYG